MRFPIAILSALLLLVGGVSVAAAKAPTHELVGEVVSLDATAKTLSVSAHPMAASPDAMKFSVASDLKVVAGAKAEAFGQLSVGDQVTVTYLSKGDTNVATRIDRTASLAPAKKSQY